MQLKLMIDDAVGSTAKSPQSRYGIVVSCNKCGGAHDMGVSFAMVDGPVDKQSIGDFYRGKTVPKNLAELSGHSVTCPKTGRQSTQKNNHQIFLIPTPS